MDENERPEPAALEAEPQATRRRSPVWAVVAVSIAVVLVAVVIGVTVTRDSKSKSNPQVGAAESGLHLVRGPSTGTGAAAMPFAPTTYILDAPLPNLGDHAAAYRLDAPPIDVATMQHYADVLRVSGPVRPVGAGMSVTDNGAHLVVVSGTEQLFSYSTGRAGSGGVVSGAVGSTGETSSIPSTSTTTPAATSNAMHVTTDTLQKLGVLGDVSDWNIAADGGAVKFIRVVDGVAVTDETWQVDVADDGSLTGVSGIMGTPTKIADVPIRPVTDVWKDVENGTYISPEPRPLMEGALGAPISVVPLPAVSAPPPGAATVPPPPSASVPPALEVHIIGVTLGLALWPTTDSGMALVPTYRFAEKDRGEIEALAVTDAAFATPPAVTTTTLGSIGSLPTIKALPPTASGGVTVIATMHLVPGTAAPSGVDVRIELTNSIGAAAEQNSTMILPETDGATTTAHIPLGKYFVNSYGSAAPTLTHAEQQFTAQNGETVHLDLHYGGTIPTITATVTPPSK
jgi:hypothetical protein